MNILKLSNIVALRKLFVAFVFAATLCSTSNLLATTYYVSSSGGNNNRDGLTPETAWQTLSKVNDLTLTPGTSILFKAGDTFVGILQIENEGGSESQPVIFGKYGTGDNPILAGDGNLSSILIDKSNYLQFSHLEIKNDNPVSKSWVNENKRYGIRIINTSSAEVYGNYEFENLTFKSIYQTTLISDDDQTGVDAYGIVTEGGGTKFRNVTISNCYFTRISRHATFLKAIDNLKVLNNHFEHVGGAGIVVGAGSSNVLVEDNYTDHTGSTIDTRMAGRGSGIWCWGTTNVMVQNNRFTYACGIKDSYGMHIDINNRNLVYQYNYSLGNEGGFVEVLGGNLNVGYRYNVSIADGWRRRGTQTGRIFWIGDWSGDVDNPAGSDKVFIYNNSVYVPDTMIHSPYLFHIAQPTLETRIYNNIVFANREITSVHIKNNASYNDIDHNIWYGNIPALDTDGEAYKGANDVSIDPLFAQNPVTEPDGFILQQASEAIGAGKLIFDEEKQGDYDFFDSHGGRDYFDNEVSQTGLPNIGAYGLVSLQNPNEIYDPLDNLSLAHSSSANVRINTGTPEDYNGDGGRFGRSSTADAEIVYHLQDLNNFMVEFFNWRWTHGHRI